MYHPPTNKQVYKYAGIELYVLYEYLAAMYTSWFALRFALVIPRAKFMNCHTIERLTKCLMLWCM